MPDFTPLHSNDLAGCISNCDNRFLKQNDGTDFAKFLRKVAAERMTSDSTQLSAEMASVFIMRYEKQIPGARKDRVLERDEAYALVNLLKDEFTAEKQSLEANGQNKERIEYLSQEIEACMRFAKELA